jgi:hypothetical protein
MWVKILGKAVQIDGDSKNLRFLTERAESGRGA